MQQDPKPSSSEQEVLIGPYRILKTLGTGNFAQVKLAVHLHTKMQVALKTLEKDKKNATLISTELEIMKLVDHPNITKLFHVMETSEHVCMVMEYAPGGDLAGRIIEVSYIQEEEARHIFTQIVCAVNYCHKNGIAHRDIKPENILMDARRNIKLCDFGLAIKVNTEQKSTVFCGTLPYCAPELFSIQSYDPRALDIWSMGVVLYIMVTKHYPFKATTYDKMREEMRDPHYYIPPKLPAHIANLIMQLFTIDPLQRPKIGDVAKHQWLQGSEELSKITLPQETLSSKPSPSIMAIMGAMGYNPKDITDSLYKKKFNSIMATYLILKHQSPYRDSANRKFKLIQPRSATIPTDPPTVHVFLKNIGTEPDNSTSAPTAKDKPYNNAKLVRKDSKNPRITDAMGRQKTRVPPETAAQCGPVQRHQEPLLKSSLLKRNVASSAVSSFPVQYDRDQFLNSSLQKRGVVSKAVSCGPVQYVQRRNMMSKAVSCGPVEYEDEHPPSHSSQKRGVVSKAVSCGPVEYEDEHPLSHSLQKRGVVSKAVSCGSMQHDLEQLPSFQKTNMVSKAVSCGPVQLSNSTLQKGGLVSKAVSCGSMQHDLEQLPSFQKTNMVSKAVSCGPVQLSNSTLQMGGLVSKAVSCGSMQHDLEQLPSFQKTNMVSKAVSCGPVQLSNSTLQNGGLVSKAVSCESMQHDHEHLLSGSMEKRNTVASRGTSPDTAPSMDVLSEYHIFQMDPQGESLTKCSSYIHSIASVWSSEEKPQDMATTDCHHKDRSLSLQETSEPSFAAAQTQCVTTASPQNSSGRWKRAKRRMVKCLRRLCCCLPDQRRSCTSQRRVLPQEVGESGVTQNQALLQ
ncbi:serine/threonine-protein kinase MARK2-like isoform X1 [Rattus norvegicus]|uniref:serine/threonine-protein kinase MARK2-like isoform X1 n=1 Tax=Rattus norvegicus TaxID=10116 RepID=UPI0003D08F24|nr:serine/threonine-protein kinase MARK2-like isoform X1 [Rattus norvegicus]XP_038952320.1 serine/threonine-protein kinase MARK2-like isoform X1 [Rattus norvegicus]XP_038952321.1 serine/threonine-protein kinase MARK2-like isoform X1 [Rattus norvegicus]XP_038952322.1 serine/threonine-protein kinase MARK2-like isoform X1 [Rattus norvegicus]XP_038952323.1 serine/threonine-protein kinase MARK2-like isoform X1 [Rattus norvegicus]XP_038952324.1 serine/threonine-protein kinase MARK2-like isoform X1 [